MDGHFYRSYRSFPMYPVTIHCKGMKYKGATIVSAGFALFGETSDRVSAYVSIKDGTPELAGELLEKLDQEGNFNPPVI